MMNRLAAVIDKFSYFSNPSDLLLLSFSRRVQESGEDINKAIFDLISSVDIETTQSHRENIYRFVELIYYDDCDLFFRVKRGEKKSIEINGLNLENHTISVVATKEGVDTIIGSEEGTNSPINKVRIDTSLLDKISLYRIKVIVFESLDDTPLSCIKEGYIMVDDNLIETNIENVVS